MKDKLKKKLKKYGYYLGIAVLVCILAGLATLAVLARNLPSPTSLNQQGLSQSTRIYDRTGEVLLFDLHGEERRTNIVLKDMPENLIKTTLAAEDKDFYRHFGIDFRGILRAFWADLKGRKISQGGSTITQQLIKNSILTPERTVTRKIKEVILALELEIRYSKEQILEMYFNQIPYGSNAYGVEAAANLYFSKSAKDLSLAEFATLAAMIQSPSYYSPFGPHKQELLQRQKNILQKTYDLGLITKDELDSASAEKLVFSKQKYPIKAPHFVFYVEEYLKEKYGENLVNQAGWKVITTLDWDLQQKAEKIIGDGAKINDEKWGARNAALVAIDPQTGQILTMVGSRDYFDEKNDGNVNVTLSDQRSPGSSFKPFAYAAAFEKGYTDKTIVFDVPMEFNPLCSPFGTPPPDQINNPEFCYNPQNYDERFRGAVTFRDALGQSLNVPAVQVEYLAGLSETIDMAERLGISTLKNRNNFGLSLVLGGAGVKPLEIARAYGVFAQQGVLHQTAGVLKIIDANGKVIENFSDSQKRVLDANVANMISDILSDNNARTPVFGANSDLYFPNHPVAAKTGTTSDFHDAWTVGYSTNIATAVWVGNNDNTKMKGGADGSVVAAPIFHNYMQNFLDDSDFARPEQIKDITVEKFSNKLPSQYSRDLVKDIFASWQAPTDRDNINVIMKVNKTNNQIATDSTPAELVEEKLFANIHNEWGDAWKKYMNWEGPVRAWAESAGLLLPPTGDDSSYSRRPEISFATPTGGTISGEVSLAVNVNSDKQVASVTYYLDDAEVASSTSSPFTAKFNSAKYSNGAHKLTAKLNDVNGVSSQVSIQVTTSNTSSAKISGVSVSSITGNSAKITFSTDQKANTTVFYGLSASSLSSSASAGSMATSHSANLSGLASGKKYYYRITALTASGQSSSADGNFNTL